MTVKYLIFADAVKSINDGDIHHITAKELLSLYGLHPDECLLFEKDSKEPIPKGNFIILGPRTKGDYREFIELIKKRHI